MERSSSCFHPELPQRAAWGLGAGSWWVCGSFSWSLPELLPKRDALPREGEESRTKPEPDPFPAPSCLLSCWLAGAHPAPSPLPRTAWVLWGPECTAGSIPQRLAHFPCGCSSSLTGNTQFGGRRAPGSEAWLTCHLTGRPPWEVRVGTGRDSRPGRGTDHTLGRRGPGAGLVG